MSFNISSNRFANPLLKEILEKLTDFFSSIGSDYFVIGATARDIVITGIYDQLPGRKTDDLDIAIAISDWNRYQEISGTLCEIDGFTKSKDQKQRFLYKGVYMLDIVPFGDVAKADQSIYWPPDESIAMSVLGFSEVLKETLEITIDDTLTIKVADLPGIFILKLNAWDDRHYDRDAEDIAFILENYFPIHDKRMAEEHYDLFLEESFTPLKAGAALLGRDIRSLLSENRDLMTRFAVILETELIKEFDSPLLNQMLEKKRQLKYEEVYNAISSIVYELRKQ